MQEPNPGQAAPAPSAQFLVTAAQLERIEELNVQRRRMVLRRIPPSVLLLWAKCHGEKQESGAAVPDTQELPACGVGHGGRELAFARLEEPWNGF